MGEEINHDNRFSINKNMFIINQKIPELSNTVFSE
jgi:hypothetical protein